MNKQELTKDLKGFVNGASFITKTEMCKYLGVKDHKTVNKYFEELTSINHKYFIPEIVERIIENERII